MCIQVSDPATLERISGIELDTRLSRSDDVTAHGSSQMVPPDDREDISVGTSKGFNVINKLVSLP